MSALVDTTVSAGHPVTLVVNDPENNPSLALTATGMPSCMTISGTTFIIDPLQAELPGVYTVVATSDDGA